ncbi:MAG TPA: 2-phospho-L-lactate guanylyltransferase [Actinomycetota bacterium]|nr:2-phospho-L-lactate guanylyltransferase [Actinomycetota bacterium]
MRVVAVPVKSLERAKGRLSEVLTPLERGALTLAMLEDVLDASTSLPGWQTVVVSPDQSVLEVAARRRVRPMEEAEPGLVSAVRQVEQAYPNAEAMTVVLGDLPLLTVEALQRVTRTLGSVVAAPSSSDEGTNVLLRRPPGIIAPMFGTDSFARHRDAAELRDVPFGIVRSPELAFDLDRPSDIAQVLEWPARTRTRSACLEMGLPDRLNLRVQ